VAEASARARMAENVTLEDAERAIRIVREYLRRVIGRGGDELEWDSDVLNTGVPQSQQQRRITINKLMKRLLHEDSQGFTLNQVVEIAAEDNITEDKVLAIWENMRKNGEIFQVGKRGDEPIFKLVHEL